MFKFQPQDYVTITVFDLNFDGRVVRAIYEGPNTPPIYDVSYARDGELKRAEFYEDELSPRRY